MLISGYANTENIFYCSNVNYIEKAIQVKQLLFDLNCFFSVSKGPPFPKFYYLELFLYQVHDNSLTMLPGEIGQLVNLKRLNLRYVFYFHVQFH